MIRYKGMIHRKEVIHYKEIVQRRILSLHSLTVLFVSSRIRIEKFNRASLVREDYLSLVNNSLLVEKRLVKEFARARIYQNFCFN